MNMEKKLYRIKKGAVLEGVCTGLAAYFKVDVNLVRILALILAFTSGVGVVAYILAVLMLPETEESVE